MPSDRPSYAQMIGRGDRHGSLYRRWKQRRRLIRKAVVVALACLTVGTAIAIVVGG